MFLAVMTGSFEYEVVKLLQEEITKDPPPVNAAVTQLVNGFVRYLKEPRYQSPLTLSELSVLFHNFYQDLNSTVITVYTQSNSIKKQLISNCRYFKQNPHQFDYLLSIANYSSSSIKLVKRTDPDAVRQLRIFNVYKFLVVFNIIEQGQISLFKSINNKEDDISLYDKIFRFDEKALIIQDHLDHKLAELRQLHLPFEQFIDKNDNSKQDAELISFMHSQDIPELDQLIQDFCQINLAITPLSKLKIVVEFQKKLITLLLKQTDLKQHHVNNDTLLPVLIYLIIHKFPPQLDLFLNFEFIKNFVNLIDPYHVNIISNTSFYFYNPNEGNRAKNVHKSTTLYNCINLNEQNDNKHNEDNADNEGNETIDNDNSNDNDHFKSDKEIVQFLNANYLNNSELNYFLTNFEAVLFFIQNVTLDELSDLKVDSEILNKPISSIVERELAKEYQFPPKSENIEEPTNAIDNGNRSRSSSLFNTLTSKIINEATTRNRSRSNSGILKNTRESFPTVDDGESGAGDDESFLEGPVRGHDPIDNSTTFNMMRSILGRFGSVSQIRGSEEDGLVNDTKHSRSASIVERLSPNLTRTRSLSLENYSNNNGKSNITNHSALYNSALSPRKNTIASKLSSGVSEIMTKFNNPNTTTSPIKNQSVNNSDSSLRSVDETNSTDKFNDNSTIIQKRPDSGRSRTASIQIMEKWFNNISTNSGNSGSGANAGSSSQLTPLSSTNASHANQTPTTHNHKNTSNESVSISHEGSGSVFSTPSKELTKFQNVDFDSLTVMDLRLLKCYYDQLCNELNTTKFESKSTNEELNQLDPSLTAKIPGQLTVTDTDQITDTNDTDEHHDQPSSLNSI